MGRDEAWPIRRQVSQNSQSVHGGSPSSPALASTQNGLHRGYVHALRFVRCRHNGVARGLGRHGRSALGYVRQGRHGYARTDRGRADEVSLRDDGSGVTSSGDADQATQTRMGWSVAKRRGVTRQDAIWCVAADVVEMGTQWSGAIRRDAAEQERRDKDGTGRKDKDWRSWADVEMPTTRCLVRMGVVCKGMVGRAATARKYRSDPGRFGRHGIDGLRTQWIALVGTGDADVDRRRSARHRRDGLGLFGTEHGRRNIAWTIVVALGQVRRDRFGRRGQMRIGIVWMDGRVTLRQGNADKARSRLEHKASSGGVRCERQTCRGRDSTGIA